MLKIQGRYLSGKTSKEADAFLEAYDNKAVYLFRSESEARTAIDLSCLSVSSRLGRTPREILLGDGQMLITEDHAGADALVRLIKGKNNSFVYRLESHLPVIFLSLILTVVFVGLGIVYGIPKTAQFLAHEFPALSTDKFSDGLSVLDKTWFEPSALDADKQAALLARFEPFLNDHQALTPRVHFRSGVGPNAFALPNGDIIFTDEFVALAEHDEELIAVLFHELGHLHHKHMARRAIQDAMMALFALFILGDVNSADLVTAIPTLLLDLSYSRDFEREADQYALEQLKASHIPVDRFASIMMKLDKASQAKQEDESDLKLPGYLSTHPLMHERISEIKRAADSAPH